MDYFSIYVPYVPQGGGGGDGALPPVLRIALIVIAGDADLYVSTTAVYPGALDRG